MSSTQSNPNTATLFRNERQRQNLSYRQLGHFAGCSHTTISRFEKGEINISPQLKARLARVLRVRVDEVFPMDGAA